MRKGKRMKVVVAIDSLKGSLPSIEAGKAIAAGIKRVDETAEIAVRPLADGGEGTVETLIYGMGGNIKTVTVTGPLGEKIDCSYGIINDKKIAVIEMASAAGLPLVPDEQKNPLYTTTFGVGELIKNAISEGCRNFLVGIGGSATNDGGVGMLQALGVEFLTKEGKNISLGAIGLGELSEIRTENVVPELKDCQFRIACDVENVLCGENGCSAVFGPQKGATEEMVKEMDIWLSRYAELTKAIYEKSDPLTAGSGAAGGLGFAFQSYTNAVLESGIQIVLDITNLEKYIEDADLIITGEGRLDAQPTKGKAPIGVAALAKKHGVPVVALTGMVGKDAAACNRNGIDAYFSILQTPITLENAMEEENTKRNLTATAEQVYRLFSRIKQQGGQ